MASLLDLLSSYPILETLVSVLPLGDLFNLSKTNSSFRAALHGFPPARPYGISNSDTIPHIGQHDTAFWKNLKAKSPILCSEPNHTRGNNIRGCLMCSMPVCEACIIKESFGKRDEKTFQHRTRTLCPDCYDSDNPHIEQTLKPESKGKSAMRSLSETGITCICTPKDGHLCLGCKIEQRSNLAIKLAQCYGQGCIETQPGGFSGRICLWCDLRLPSERSRAEARRDYDARHLLARSYSSFEHREDDELIYPKEQELIWRMEEERFQELRNLSARRQNTAEWAELERWHQIEGLRRPDSMSYPSAPVLRQRTDDATEINLRQRYLSASPSFIGREQLPLPSYESSLPSARTTAEGSQETSDSKT